MFRDFLDRLYEDIGTKIKNLAKWVFVVEAISTVITGFYFLFSDEDTIVTGLLTILFGPVAVWISTWLLYAFGELVDNSASSVHILHTIARPVLDAEAQARKEAREQAKKEAEQRTLQDAEKRAHQLADAQAEQVVEIPHQWDLDLAPEKKPEEPSKPAAPTTAPAEKTLKDHLTYALSYRTDEGMISYLKRVDDEIVVNILQEPPQLVRGLVEKVLETL